MTLKPFQTDAITDLLGYMEDKKVRDITLKSPTGSGKTTILCHFMDEYLKRHPRTVFVWLTPGTGELEEQSRGKMRDYINGAKTKNLNEILVGGFEAGDCCFVNWEALKENSNALKRGEQRPNFPKRAKDACKEGLCFKVIVDESHYNDTLASQEIISYLNTDKIVRSSATPKKVEGTKIIPVDEGRVIQEGLLKKTIVINEDFRVDEEKKEEKAGNNPVTYLLEKALRKQRALRKLFEDKGLDINPLIIVQLPNESSKDGSKLIERAVEFFRANKITYGNGKLAIHLSPKNKDGKSRKKEPGDGPRKKNINGITEKNAKQEAVIIKQAIAMGWDCPRAHILVKLRTNMEKTFEIQTIGRIRRMPEGKHYYERENYEGKYAPLNRCYIYTFDDQFIEEAKAKAGAQQAKRIELKKEYKELGNILTKEQRKKGVDSLGSTTKALEAITRHFQKRFDGIRLGGNKETQNKNKEILARKRSDRKSFIFTEKIILSESSGEVEFQSELKKSNLKKGRAELELTDDDAEWMLNSAVAEIDRGIGMFDKMRQILFLLFCEGYEYKHRLLSLSEHSMYFFIINNMAILHEEFCVAMAEEPEQKTEQSFKNVSEVPFTIPPKTMLTYKASNKAVCKISKKNVYEDYLYLVATPRSNTERAFEKFCEKRSEVDWIYKNGDKGEEYFSIAYTDESGKVKLFYPDYILSIRGTIWIIEAKGGFTRSGESKDIDTFSEKKFNELKRYLDKHRNLRGGFVRVEGDSQELIIATMNYDKNNVASDDWELLEDVIKAFPNLQEINAVKYPLKDKINSTILIYSSKKQIGIKAEAAEDGKTAPSETDDKDKNKDPYGPSQLD